jgi:two-component system, OmpR family, sensor kinase
VTFPASRLRSLKNKLALIFFGITALALSGIFFYVVPQLESSLESQALDNLRRVAMASSGTLEQVRQSDSEATKQQLNVLVRAAADASEGRVTLLGRDPEGGLHVISDSRVLREIDIDERVALSAAGSGRVATGTATDEDGVRVAQAARPLGEQGEPVRWIVLFSRSLEDVSDTVSLIQKQLLVASAFALLVALAGGYLVASALARRVGRVERAARQVAAGEFVDPLPIDSDDELGRLTRAFNEMERQLAQVDRARRDFIANASHELRTPIFSLGGFVELLEDEEIDPETRVEFLRAMREQVGRLQKLAVDLLDLSRLDAGALELQPEPVNLVELAHDVVGEFAPAVGQRRTALDLRLPPGGVEAYCDPERVTQIMRIMLDNALRHTPEGTRVTVAATRRNGAAQFAVSDSGPGLDGEVTAQLFQRFYTGDAARGSGLGLAIAKELAERMDGRIEVQARPGRTVFTLALPSDAGQSTR